MSGDLSLDPDTTRSWGDREWLDTTAGHDGSNDHLALLYTDRAEQLTTVAAYVRRGMARDERCLYVADHNSVRAVRTAFEESGIDVEAALDAGALSVVTAEEASLDAGSFDRSAAAGFWDDALDRAQQAGFDGLRVATEMTWTLDAGVDPDSLVSYEHALNPQHTGADCTVLCQYSRDRFPSETVEAVASAHPLLVDGATVRHNSRYQPAGANATTDAGSEDTAPERDRAATTPDTPAPSAAPPPVDSPVRVLLVDDDPEYAEMVGECLGSSGGIDEVVTETDPRRAARRLEDGSFDCVVSDYEMPGLDGIELLDLVREDHPDLPFLMLTARGDEETAVDAISAGITGYFRKRGSTDQYAKLAHRISSVVSRYRAERKAAATRRQYTRLAEESTDVIAVLDERWRIEYLSPAAERQLGHPPEALVGDVVFDHIHPADRETARDRLGALTDGSRESVAAEFRVRQHDGSWLWVEARGRNLLDDPDVRGLILHVRDVSERKERQRDLRESERRFRSMFEEAFDAMVIADDEGRCVDANPAAHELFGLSRERLLDQPLAGFVPDGHDAEWPRRASRARGTVPLRTATGTRRVVEFAATPDVVPGRHLFVLRDVTDREQYEQTLTTLHDSSREFLAAESRTDVTETVVDTATEVLSMPVVAVYLFDDTEGTLTPAVVSDATVDVSALESLAPGRDGVVGATFLDGEPRLIRPDAAATPPGGLPLVDGVVAPLGDHGVCVVGDTKPGVSDADRDLVETLAATAETALDRVERGAELRDRTAELESQNERLEQLHELNATVREIGKTIAQADTRADIERGVCRHLSTAEGIALVRVSGYDPEDDCLVPHASEGDARVEDYHDSDPVAVDDAAEPAARAVATESPVYVPNTAADRQTQPWRRSALAAGLQSVVSLPLTYKHISYGTLTVYAERAEFFDELSRLALADLSNKIANVMNAVEHQHAVLSETVTEVTVRFTDERIALYDIASRLDCSLALETVAPQSGGDILSTVRVTDGDAAAVADVATEVPAVSDATPVTGTDGGDVVELRFSNKPLGDYLADRGVRVLESVVDAESATYTISVPDTVDVRALLESLTTRYGSPELVAKTERDAAVRAERRYRSELTPRQREVVRTAHEDGFFESPRACAAEDIADELGISPQTFYRHVRTAERKLFDAVFDPPRE